MDRFIIAKDPRKFENPAGLYVSFVRDGIVPPASFVSSHRRKQIEQAEREKRTAESLAAARLLEFEARYAEYRDEQVNLYIQSLTADARQKLSKEARKAAAKCVTHFDLLTREQQDDLISRFEFNIVVGEIPALTREEFQNREQYQQLSLPSSTGR